MNFWTIAYLFNSFTIYSHYSLIIDLLRHQFQIIDFQFAHVLYLILHFSIFRFGADPMPFILQFTILAIKQVSAPAIPAI